MILCAAGDTHGALDRFYRDVLVFEQVLRVTFDWVLHVGDFGAWPDPNRIDSATKRHDGAGDFPAWIAARRAAPRPTVFIKGNHEDFDWLDAQPNAEVLPNLHYVSNGRVQEIATGNETRCVGGLGGCHGPSNYERASSSLKGAAKRHYTRDEIATLSKQSDVDILLTHDAPAGVRLERHSGDGFISDAAGLRELVQSTRPRVCFFGHHHMRVDTEVAGVQTIGPNKVEAPGHLVAIEMLPGAREFRLVGEWPRGRS
jgi:Icc-related predicted phosphoesterase